MASIDPRSIAQLRDLERQLGESAPRRLYRQVRQNLYRDAQAFKRKWGPDLDRAFDIGSKRVLRGFKVYTAGDSLDTLELGIFTRWPAAQIHQTGGTITPKRTKWLVVPVSQRVLTPTGRVRREYRDARTGQFSAKFWDGIQFIKTRRGLLAVREVTGTPHSRVGFRARQFSSSGSRISQRSRPALEIVAILIKKTGRDAVMDFFAAYERYGLQIDAIGGQLENLITPSQRNERP